MEQCEVLIVGGGPAGATCARVLAHWGISVLLMDRDEFPRDKPCAGWITPSVLETLRIDPAQYRKGRELQEIREFHTGVMFGRQNRYDFGTPVSYAIRRREFDHYLLLHSKSRNILGEEVRSLERTPDGWLVNDRIRARLVVGAGGHHCPVARILGAQPAREQPIAAVVAEFELDPGEQAAFPLPPGHTSLSFLDDVRGYGWLVRKGAHLNVGLGVLGGTQVRGRLDAYLEHLRRTGALPGTGPLPFKGHAYLPFRGVAGRRIVGDRALVIGDAAGLAYPESGEGILPAVESAILAAQTILCASADYRPRWLEPYAAAVAERFGGAGSAAGRMALPAPVQRLGTRLLLGTPWLTRHLVLDRWFLHREQRPLVPRALPE
ncbi:geranylgeranyl reductase [Geomonas silvestris]|uniref:Geranylgeranyl reductase n=1 Tax=Geomonas silvestris TaxID=2740184 RepID=A0A6V8MP63_9BACT|nr:NAD(P)/FAD-dependent oxidoreductase [Geomonas silvestris]GFO61702.1 geranylgeranyl reductase [Geomonas silvestris]